MDLWVAYGQYYLVTSGAEMPTASTGGTGLVGAQGDAAFVTCGTDTGSIDVTVRTYDAAPPIDPGPWDDIVEVGLNCPDGALRIAEWGGGGIDLNLAAHGPGTYRVRVYARGRDAARDGIAEDEAHLIETWPGHDHSTVIHRATDQVGAYWRHAERNNPADIASAPDEIAVFEKPAWKSPPEGEVGRRVPVGQTLVREPNVEVTLTAIVIHSTGWMFELSADARRGELDETGWHRIDKLVSQGFVHVDNPGQPPTTHEDGLRLTVACPGQPAATTDRGTAGVPEPPQPPMLTGYWRGLVHRPDRVDAQHAAWLWPAPSSAGTIQVTLQWNALGIAPATIDIDVDTSTA